MPAQKYKGRNFVFGVGGTPFSDHVTSVVLRTEDADEDTSTFGDLSTGSQVWVIEGEAVSDYASGSLWSTLNSFAGTGTAMDWFIWPYGNATPSLAQPHYSGKATIDRKPAIGGTAGETFTFEFRLDVTQGPTRAPA